MSVRVIGPHPLANDAEGRRLTRIATVFVRDNTVVTLPGIHATQRLHFFDLMAQQREQSGMPPLTRQQEQDLSDEAVDLVREENSLLIRPDPNRMSSAVEADELLQQLVPKSRIRFLNTQDSRVRDVIKRRGECWRTATEPTSPTEMKHFIAASRKAIGLQEIYYYSRATGTHFLTCDEFARLEELNDEDLHRHLVEIRKHSLTSNRLGNPEIGFFSADANLGAEFRVRDFATFSPHDVRPVYGQLVEQFRRFVPTDLKKDDLGNPAWRMRMYSLLTAPSDTAVQEEVLMGLSPEFFMQIKWLPGGRIEGHDLIWDSVFEQQNREDAADLICDQNVKGFFLNLYREYGDLEYANIGRVVQSLSHRTGSVGRRGVYIGEIKRRGLDKESVKIIRMQKWDVGQRLDEGRGLLQAMLDAEEYAEYILDRRLGCRQLGMELPLHISAHKIAEIYRGKQQAYRGTRIWSTYFSRDYAHGIATDKIPLSRFADQQFALNFARLLGQAAAANMIVGRCDVSQRPLFDDGDEVLVSDRDRTPSKIVVADHTGAFADYRTALVNWADEYALPILNRAEGVEDFDSFAQAYLAACLEDFRRMQREYRHRRAGFDTLFTHRPREEAGSFGYRWERVLQRLDTTDCQALEQDLGASLKSRSI